MYSDRELATFFKTWDCDREGIVDNTSATADMFERIWSQVQNFQQGSVQQITATAVTMLDWVAREHCLNIDQTVVMVLIHDRIAHTKSF